MPVIDMTDPKQRAEYLQRVFGYSEPPKFPYQKPDSSDAFLAIARQQNVKRVHAARPEEV